MNSESLAALGYLLLCCGMRDASWVKARIAARILLRQDGGKVTARDRRLAARLAQDRGVTDRLIDQALASICAEKGFAPDYYHALLRRTLAA